MMYLVSQTKLEYATKQSPLISRAASTRLHELFLVDEVCIWSLEAKWEEPVQKELSLR